MKREDCAPNAICGQGLSAQFAYVGINIRTRYKNVC